MLKTKQKWYARPDPIFNSDVTEKPAAEDDFKRSRTIIRKSKIEH